MTNTFIFICITFLSIPLWAQKPASLIEEADKMMAAGKTAEAAERYERAGRLRNGDPELLIQAGEAWYEVRNYRKAANCLQASTKENARFPLAALHYARALKQCGRYEEALASFKRFGASYEGPGKVAIHDAVRADIVGCEMALQQAAQQRLEEDPLIAVRLPDVVNAKNQHEKGPLPFNDDVLYFFRMYGNDGPSQLLKTLREDSSWTKAEQADGLPVALRPKLGEGCFSNDFKRFYYTQVELGSAARQHLYVIQKLDDGAWSEPQRLRRYINLPESDVRNPAVCKVGNMEFLFFSSDRPGGFGGYDIWFCERPADSPELDFSLPRNLGSNVNTAGHEFTPRFDLRTQTLWFSSNGRASMGGQDIFFTQKEGDGWTVPTNMGIPYNSPADDLYFFPKNKGRGGFLVSNRMYESEKTDTVDQDLFEIR